MRAQGVSEAGEQRRAGHGDSAPCLPRWAWGGPPPSNHAGQQQQPGASCSGRGGAAHHTTRGGSSRLIGRGLDRPWAPQRRTPSRARRRRRRKRTTHPSEKRRAVRGREPKLRLCQSGLDRNPSLRASQVRAQGVSEAGEQRRAGHGDSAPCLPRWAWGGPPPSNHAGQQQQPGASCSGRGGAPHLCSAWQLGVQRRARRPGGGGPGAAVGGQRAAQTHVSTRLPARKYV